MIYLDNAATTRMRDEVLDKMLPYMTESYGNPSSGYGLARETKKAIDDARETIRGIIGAEKTSEILFTSSGTESDNTAIKGIMSREGRDREAVTSSYEHHAVLNSFASLEDKGYTVRYLRPNGIGIIEPDLLEQAVTETTSLVSIMYVNNETGSINNIKELSARAHQKGAVFHTDAVQAVGHLNINVKDLGVDMLSASAHKFYGPKGIGFLYVRDGVRYDSLMDGGSQERGKRAGTENVAAIVGMAEALRLAADELEREKIRLKDLKRDLAGRLLREFPCAVINGSVEENMPGILNVSFTGKRNDMMVARLDMEGICVSAGAACTAGTTDHSHVLTAIGLTEERTASAVRFSFGRYNTKKDIDVLMDVLRKVL